ncbi:hypothetical protein C8P67_103374 [Flavobacterium aquicola]|uniref:Uncharacterized protein n=1 Tax=Flavobacterium aquicola TaxID=1682742 RepID=A0A3E0EQG9_9FLAO|nr:hypothetical protein C8P67_103374 [Flavobacterium aquicola]
MCSIGIFVFKTDSKKLILKRTLNPNNRYIEYFSKFGAVSSYPLQSFIF